MILITLFAFTIATAHVTLTPAINIIAIANTTILITIGGLPMNLHDKIWFSKGVTAVVMHTASTCNMFHNLFARGSG